MGVCKLDTCFGCFDPARNVEFRCLFSLVLSFRLHNSSGGIPIMAAAAHMVTSIVTPLQPTPRLIPRRAQPYFKMRSCNIVCTLLFSGFRLVSILGDRTGLVFSYGSCRRSCRQRFLRSTTLMTDDAVMSAATYSSLH